jgi:hypothetical protein
VDVDEIEHGDFQEHINQALVGCQWYVLVLSPEAIHSNWVRMETNAAIQRKMAGQLKEILPVVARPIDPATIPPTWDTFQRFDASADYPGALARLLHAMGLFPPLAQLPSHPTSASQQRPPLHGGSPQTRTNRKTIMKIVSLLLLLVLFIGGTLVAFGARARQTPQTHAGTHATPTVISTPTAAEWQPVIAAVRGYCAAIEAQDYHKSFALLSQQQQDTTGESYYVIDTSKWDDYTGKLILCTPHQNPATDFIHGKLAVITFSVQRTSEKSPDIGSITLVKEGNTWRVDTPEYSLMLF